MMSLENIDKKLSERFKDGFSKLSSIPDPNLLKDGKKAVKRIHEAIKNNEKIVLVGDYDADGVISSVIAYEFFQQINFDITVVIPNRFKDGYGITPHLINREEFKKADLVLTVDNGIHANESAEILRHKGIDFIVTDHHSLSQDTPNAFAIVNPKQSDCEYPFKDICGAQVIWLVLALLKQEMNLKIDMSQFLELLAIAIVADIMPLKGINHTIVKKGFQKLNNSERPAFKAMKMQLSHRENFNFDDIGFFIGPRLNSSGRMKDALYSFNLLTSTDINQAIAYLEIIESLNSKRKEIEKNIFNMSLEKIDNSNELILHFDKKLHQGVIGIVATKLVELYQKPVILFMLDENEETLQGSARSFNNINIFQIIKSAEEYLIRWGGHKMAAGLSLEYKDFELFKTKVNSEMKKLKILDKKEAIFDVPDFYFGELMPKDISMDLVNIQEKYEPFGEQNRKPLFFMKNAKIIDIIYMGQQKQFSKVTIELQNIKKEVLIFKTVKDLNIGDEISFSFYVGKSEYKKRVDASIIFDKKLKLK